MPNHHRRRFAVAFRFELRTLDGIVARRCVTRAIQRRLGILHYQLDRDVGVVSAQTQDGARHGNEHFRYRPCPRLNHLLPEKPTALYVRVA